MKLGLYIYDTMGKCRTQEPYSLPVYVQSYLPITILFLIMDACFETTWSNLMKLIKGDWSTTKVPTSCFALKKESQKLLCQIQ